MKNIALVTCAILVCSISRAEVIVQESVHDGKMVSLIAIRGEISDADARSVDSFIGKSTTDNSIKLLVLDTPGGSVEASMKIGRAIRNAGYLAQVQPNGKCFSACIYILSAALKKQVLGKVGIHRPYFSEYHGDNPGAYIAKMLKESGKYFEDMNVPASLAEAMFSTPPQNMKILSPDELSFYRLNQDDFEYEENSDIEQARNMGLSREQYLAFKKDLDYRCKIHMGNSRAMDECIEMIYRKHTGKSLGD